MESGFENKSSHDDKKLGFVKYKRGFRTKRVLVSEKDSRFRISFQSSAVTSVCNSESNLESLHQDILIQIFCHVDHKDLSSLLPVSKIICDAVLEAKKWHFDNTTPRKRIPFRDDEMEPPGAPMRRRITKRKLDLSTISTVLFP